MSSTPNTKLKVTELLQDYGLNNSSDDSAEKQLRPILYETMRRISNRYISQEKEGYTLQATDLVHEAYELLVDVDIHWENRKHFYAIAAKTLRRLLVDRAREKNAIKRGGGLQRVTLDESTVSCSPEGDDILQLEESLEKLQQLDERKANIIELHFYAGMTYQEIALHWNISEATVDRDLRFSKAWLADSMQA